MAPAPTNELGFDEEVVLRRIAYGIVQPVHLRLRDVERLISLGLVVRRGKGLALTPQGERRFAQLPVRKLDAPPTIVDDHIIALGKALGTRR